MGKILVSIVMGSDSDLEIMREAGKALEEFGIGYEMDVTSAHRSPERTADFARKAAGRGIQVIIAGAGGAAHLAGVIAAHTTLPVIGVPIPSTSLQGMDSLLATVQMPAGIPVATVAIGKPGATNAGILAAQMIGLGDAAIAKKLEGLTGQLGFYLRRPQRFPGERCESFKESPNLIAVLLRNLGELQANAQAQGSMGYLGIRPGFSLSEPNADSHLCSRW